MLQCPSNAGDVRLCVQQGGRAPGARLPLLSLGPPVADIGGDSDRPRAMACSAAFVPGLGCCGPAAGAAAAPAAADVGR